jgi:PAS domain S-box-containing protein
MNQQSSVDPSLRLALRALGVRAALVVGGHGEVLACVGAPDPDAPAAAGFQVTDVAAVTAVALVADLSADPRFAASPWARAVPGARALGLAPLADHEGRRLGVLAVIDLAPRAWTEADAATLADLAAAAATALALRALAATEAALRASEQRHRTLFERAPEGIAIFQATGEHAGYFIDANDAAMATYGYTREEMLSMRVAEVVAPEHRAGVEDRLRRVAMGEWVRSTTVHIRKDGTRFPVDVCAGPVEINGERCYLTFPHDMTEHVRGEEALREAKLAADAANRAKSTFLANMSHEIRTPLNAVLGYTQLLQRDPSVGAAQQRHLEVILRSGDHLLALINDVLEMSKIEAGFRVLDLGTVDLGSLLGDLERMFRLRADAKGLSLAIDRAPSLPPYVVGDEGRLRQVLVNLLGNAVKFTRGGGVSVRARAGGADAPRLVVEVEDTGPGIDAEALGGLFRPFVQARAGIHAQGGTGLGLAISREYARMMGGDITVTSEVGVGSVFRLEIPLEVAAIAPAEGAARRGRVVGLAGGAPAPRILVTDDDAYSRTWLILLLEQIGFTVREATDGAEAVALFEAWRPDLVLMDMNMPVMDGYTAIGAIRALPGGAGAAIVAVTASAFDHDRSRILEAGASAVLRKPCSEAELLETIRTHLGISYLVAAPEPAAPPRAGGPGPGAIALPADVAAALREAARAADYERLTTLLGALAPDHDAFAEALAALVGRYAYDEIEALLRDAAG